MKRLIGAFFVCQACLIYGQDRKMEVIYDDQFYTQDFIEENFTDGLGGYVDFFESNLSFPEKSYKNKIEGLQLFYFEIFPNAKKVEVTFLTYLDDHIRENIENAVKSSLPKWKMTGDGPFRFYQPVVYSLLPYYPHHMVGDLPELPENIPLKFQQMFVLIKSRRIDKNLDINAARDSAKLNDAARQTYIRAEQQFRKMSELKELDHAYDALNEVIRYNPLNKEFLRARIDLEQKLGLNRYQEYDSRLLEDFVADFEKIEAMHEERIYRRTMGKLKGALDTLYADGVDEYNTIMNYGVLYPIGSINKKVQGAVIVEIQLKPNSSASFNLLNKLDIHIERRLTTLFEAMTPRWAKVDSPVTLYQPIFYSIDRDYLIELADSLGGYNRVNTKYPVLPPVTRTATMFPPMFEQGDHQKDYNKVYVKWKEQMDKGKLKKALPHLSQLIRYNPFNESLLKARIKIEEELGRSDFIENDQALLKALKYFK